MVTVIPQLRTSDFVSKCDSDFCLYYGRVVE